MVKRRDDPRRMTGHAPIRPALMILDGHGVK